MSYGFYSGEESAMEKDDFYNEVYADEPSKDQILESIATMEKTLSHLRGVVERMK